MYQLRPYQTATVEAVFAHLNSAFGTDEHGLVVLPTGSGKSLVQAEIVRRILAVAPRSRVLGLTHVKELVEQNVEKCRALGVPTGIYSAGLDRRELDYPFTMGSVQSVFRCAERLGHVHVLMVDECHRISKSGEGMYRKTINVLRETNPDLVVLGFTATPFRADGTGYLHTSSPKDKEHPLFKKIVHEVSMEELVAQGWLVRLSTKRTAVSYDTTGISTRAGDYAKGELEQAIARQADVTRDALKEATTRAADRLHWLVFCVSVAHAEETARILEELGVSCGVITGETENREEIIARYRSGEIRALVNVYVLTTGFDAPETDCLVILRPTQSAVLWVQMNGRGMRPVYQTTEGRFDQDEHGRLIPLKHDCLVLDFGENVWRLGTVADPIVKESSGIPGTPPMRVCPECEEMLYTAIRVCPSCGHFFPPPQSKVARLASEAPVYIDAEPDEWPVSSTTYHQHNKPGKPPSMRVSYQVGIAQSFSEWVCFEHEGFAQQKARKWWLAHGGQRPEPTTVAEALDRAHDELREPVKVWIRHEKAKDSDQRFARVVRCVFKEVEAQEPIPSPIDLSEAPF